MLEKEVMIQEEVMAEQEVVEEEAMMKETGTYETYSTTAVDQALADGKKVALFFHASRCPSCRSLDKDISTSNELPENTIVFKVDYDTQTDLKTQYGVTSQHTIVLIDENKNLVQKDT